MNVLLCSEEKAEIRLIFYHEVLVLHQQATQRSTKQNDIFWSIIKQCSLVSCIIELTVICDNETRTQYWVLLSGYDTASLNL